MVGRKHLALVGAFFLLCTSQAAAAITGLAVDKKTNTIHLAEFSDAGIKLGKRYRATLGLERGDKLAEGDKKTPEGIYFFEEERRPPILPKKFGHLALTMNFPNPWDAWMKRSGSGIWLHSTDEPERLDRDLDSLGCVVMKNEELAEVAGKLNHRSSPILVFEDLSKVDAKASADRRAMITQAVKKWADAWGAKRFDDYTASYHKDFRAEGGDLAHWLARKKRLNGLYQSILVGVGGLVVISHPKYEAAIFEQKYESRLRTGVTGKVSRGIKILYFTVGEGGAKILSEEFRAGQLVEAQAALR